MFRPRSNFASPTTMLTLACLCFLVIGANSVSLAQQPSAVKSDDASRGIKLYAQGDVKQAVAVLRAAVKQNKADAEAWHYLGLALHQNGDVKGAQKAFETAVKLRPDYVIAHAALAYVLLRSNKLDAAAREARRTLELDTRNAEAHYVLAVLEFRKGAYQSALKEAQTTLEINKDFGPAIYLKGQVLLTAYSIEAYTLSKEARDERKQQLKEEAEKLEEYLRSNPNTKDIDIWREQLDTMSFFAGLHDKDGSDNEVVSINETIERARIITRPEPQYTDAARQAGLNGTVILRAVFAADGKVKYIVVVQSLDYGLTEEAIRAARRIKFIPATRNGKPVSQYIQIEYNFHLY